MVYYHCFYCCHFLFYSFFFYCLLLLGRTVAKRYCYLCTVKTCEMKLQWNKDIITGPKLLFSVQIAPWKDDTSEVGTLLTHPSGVLISQVSLYRHTVLCGLRGSMIKQRWFERERERERDFKMRVDWFMFNLGICIASTQPFRAALGAESRVCYPCNTADRQTQWALTYYHFSQSTANPNGKLIHCHRWDSNLWSSRC
jgi:hypothetical protein